MILLNFILRIIGKVSDFIFTFFSFIKWNKKLKFLANVLTVKVTIVLKGRNNIVGRNTKIWSEVNGASLTLHNNVQISRDCNIDCTGNVEIKNNALISERVVIYTHSHNYDPKSKPDLKPLLIEDNSWIGSDSIILSSVGKIGKKSIIGAGSVLTKDVPNGEVWAGNPAKKIGEF